MSREKFKATGKFTKFKPMGLWAIQIGKKSGYFTWPINKPFTIKAENGKLVIKEP